MSFASWLRCCREPVFAEVPCTPRAHFLLCKRWIWIISLTNLHFAKRWHIFTGQKLRAGELQFLKAMNNHHCLGLGIV